MKQKNQLITRWAQDRTERERQRDLKVQVDRLIEQARKALEKQTKLIDSNKVMQEQKTENKIKRLNRIEEVIGRAAAKMAQDIGASCVVSVERSSMQKKYQNHEFLFVKISIYRRLNDNTYDKAEYTTRLRRLMSGSVIPIKELLAEAINKKYINKGDRVVCVEDESLEMGYKALLFVFDVDKLFFNISTMKLGNNITPEVLESVVNVALEIGKEGREGKKIGTAFILGNKEKLSAYTRQLILNPFEGHPEDQRNIMNSSIRETIKELSQMDGVFLIGEDGTVLSGGTYLNVDVSDIDMPGYGTRHRCSAAITKHCDALAVVVSESGGVTSVFKDGKLVLKLP